LRRLVCSDSIASKTLRDFLVDTVYPATHLQHICNTSDTSADLVVLIGGDGDELRFGETESAQGTSRRRHLDDVTGSNEMKARLVFVHRIQYRLRRKKNTLAFILHVDMNKKKLAIEV